MKKKKPDIFLGITMGMTVLAAVLCLVILIVQKSNPDSKKGTGNADASQQVVLDSGEKTPDASKPQPSGVIVSPSSEPQITDPTSEPVEVKAIDENALKAELEDNIQPLASDWDIVVLDPHVGTEVTAIHGVDPERWMVANRMLPVFIMATAYQQISDGKLTEDQIHDDVRAMIVNEDMDAADRLTALIGAGDASDGMIAVKSFASANGIDISYNRLMTAKSGKPNYYKASIGAKVLNKLCCGELVSKEASAQMVEILCTKKESEPFDTGLTKAVAYGFVTDIEELKGAGSDGCACTMGIVKMPTRSFVISIACYDPQTMSKVLERFTQIISLTEPYFAE